MEKVILKKIENFPNANKPDAWEIFNAHITVIIGEDGKENDKSFKINVVSTKWLENTIKTEPGIYLNYCLIMKYYDEKIVKKYLNNVICGCSSSNSKKTLNCLTYFLTTE